MAALHKKDVVFRRIKGRIVPIRVKRGKDYATRRSLRARGVGLFGAGIATTGLASGLAASKFLKGAAIGEDAKGFTKTASKLFTSSAQHSNAETQKAFNTLMGGAARRAKKMRRVLKASKYMRTGGIIAGGAIAGTGLKRFAESFQDKRDRGGAGNELLSDIGGFAVAGASAYIFKRYLKKKGAVKVVDGQMKFEGF